jgi:hypothetical protein
MEQQKNAARYLTEKDEYGYPYEPFECFSTEPLGFLETAMKLQVEARETFRFASRYNRHSPLFYQAAGKMEKLLGRLGSVCITAAAMDQQGELPAGFLDELTIGWLRGITAYIFRKNYASFTESVSVMLYNDEALGLSIRYAALDKRLQATDEKIKQIREGKVKVGLTEKDKTRDAQPASGEKPQDSEAENPAAPLPQSGRAFAIDKNAVREALQQEPCEERELPTEAQAAEISEEPAAAVPGSGNDLPEVNEADISDTRKAEDPGEYEETAALAEDEDAEEEEDGEETYYDEDEENLPYPSEDMVRRMSDLVNSPEYESWPFPLPAYSEDPP